MAINRRSFLTLTGGGLASLTFLGHGMASPGTGRYLGIRRHNADGRFVAVIADATGATLREIPLPGRAHGITLRPSTGQAIAMARRPDRFAIVFDLTGQAKPFQVNSPDDRHFQGHAVFDPTDRYLFTTENDFDGERGVIGIYDAEDQYRRIGEWASHGIGAHQLARMPGTDTLVICNGGILTHPDSGRAKLNIPTMVPSLAYIDSKTGALLDQYTPDPGRRRQLSIRHLDLLANGTTAFACQDQLKTGEVLPLVGLHRPGQSGATLLPAPKALYGAMAGYCGSIRADRSGRIIAVSAPRGNTIAFWDAETTDLIRSISLPDGCGIAAGVDPETFVLSSGTGGFTSFAPRDPQARIGDLPPSDPWDNHMTEL